MPLYSTGPAEARASFAPAAHQQLHLFPPFSTAPQAAAKRVGVELRAYSIIYDLIDDVRAAMEGRLKSGARARGLGPGARLRDDAGAPGSGTGAGMHVL